MAPTSGHRGQAGRGSELALCRTVTIPVTLNQSKAGLVLAVGLGQMLGVLPPSFPFRDWILSLDRYLLPLPPFAVGLGLWALRDLRFSLPMGWLVVVALGAFSVAGTRDFLALQHTTWDIRRYAVNKGVPLHQLDGGYSWDSYHLWASPTRTNGWSASPAAP